MLIYEVNATVEGSVADEYEAWLHEHVRQMLETGVFRKVILYRVDMEEAGHRCWSAHYYVASREDLETYFTEHAERMRGDGTRRFGGKARLDRRILTEAQQFGL